MGANFNAMSALGKFFNFSFNCSIDVDIDYEYITGGPDNIHYRGTYSLTPDFSNPLILSRKSIECRSEGGPSGVWSFDYQFDETASWILRGTGERAPNDCSAKAGFWGWLPFVPAKDAMTETIGDFSTTYDGTVWWPFIKNADPLVYYNTWGNLLPIGAWTNSALGYKVFERTPNFTGAPGVLNDGNPVHNMQIGYAKYLLDVGIAYHRQIYIELRDGAVWDEGDGVKVKINLDWTPG
jgi:hypothetical protein